MLKFDEKERLNIDQLIILLNRLGRVQKIENDIVNIMEKNATLDILFVIDITGSMDRFRDPLANSIQNILTNLKEVSNNRCIRIGCVFYKDLPPKLSYE